MTTFVHALIGFAIAAMILSACFMSAGCVEAYNKTEGTYKGTPFKTETKVKVEVNPRK